MKPLHFAVGLWAIGPCPAMLDVTKGVLECVGCITGTLVGQYLSYGDVAFDEPLVDSPPERRGGFPCAHRSVVRNGPVAAAHRGRYAGSGGRAHGLAALDLSGALVGLGVPLAESFSKHSPAAVSGDLAQRLLDQIAAGC